MKQLERYRSLLWMAYGFLVMIIVLFEGISALLFDGSGWGIAISSSLNSFCISLTPLLVTHWLLRMRFTRWLRGTLLGLWLLLSANLIYLYLVSIIFWYQRGAYFDYALFRYNQSIVLDTLHSLFGGALYLFLLPTIWFMALIFLTGRSLGINPPARSWKSKLLPTTVGVSLVIQLFTFGVAKSEVVRLVYEGLESNQLIRVSYNEAYDNYLEQAVASNLEWTEGRETSLLGDQVFLFQFESLNGLVVDEVNTPELMQAARSGIFFQRFYGTSVQSNLGYEGVLCGLPPSIQGALLDNVSVEQIERMVCLPRLMSELGYRTLFFQGSDMIEYADEDRFLPAIGFDEVHSSDIMRAEDIHYTWGYREDVFFTRLFEYLEGYRGQKIFVATTIGGTGHAPFFPLHTDAYNAALPYKGLLSFEGVYRNAMYVVDQYFGQFYERFQTEYGEGATLMLTSDHSYPIPLHDNNIFNDARAYEENFRIPFVFIPPQREVSRFDIGKTVERAFAQTDILTSVIALVDPGAVHNLVGRSFVPELLRADAVPNPQHLLLSAQPYSGGYLSFVEFPTKYLFDLNDNTLTTYDLSLDPTELSPQLSSELSYQGMIDRYFWGILP